jgi:hypothetical protein
MSKIDAGWTTEEKWAETLEGIHNALVVKSMMDSPEMSAMPYAFAEEVTDSVLEALVAAFTDDQGVIHADTMLQFIRERTSSR